MCGKIIITLSIFFLITSFYHYNNVSDKVILEVGKITITEYELEKNLDLFLSDLYRQKSRTPADTDRVAFLNSFIDRAYFLADACEIGYDTAAEINKWVESMAHYVVSNPRGLLAGKMKEQGTQMKNFDTVIAQAHIKCNAAAMTVFESHLKNRSIRWFDQNEITSTLFSYSQKNTELHITIGEFMEYYNTLPLSKEISTMAELQSYINSFVYDRYAWVEAGELGITKEMKFVLDKNNYRNDVMWAAYEKKELKAGITVADDELHNQFESMQDSFSRATDVVVSAFQFRDKRAAMMAVMNIKAGNLAPIDNNLHPNYRHKVVNYKQAFFSDSIKYAVFAMKGNGVMMPVAFDGNFIVIKKESEQGRRKITLEEVQRDLITQITAEKLLYKKAQRLEQLKKKYTLTNKIDYQKYIKRSQDKKG
ncbi:hypothetical protein [Niastella sp. OAS944]|uniref:peptidylprolyl isomerase n=1 Tax=Niastella sp. OAS944 TaxID=2664089 RepID=UPI00347AD076|nr:hypothetical protein [Chitinophagaceae bacterium OAS944]